MAVTNTHHVKTDKRDAANITRCLAFHTYSEVYVPDNDDNDVKEYIRMRDDQKLYLKKVKQQILAFVLRQGKRFEGGKTYWTIAHLKWLKTLELSDLQRETLNEYLLTYEYLTEKISRFDERIEELASVERYEEKVECFPISRVYQAHIPTYPSGHWLFGFASKKYHPVTDFNPTAWTLLGLSTRYYNAKLHRSAFSLPTYVEELLRDVEPQ